METVKVDEEHIYVWDCPNCDHINEQYDIMYDTVQCDQCNEEFIKS